MMPRAVCRAFAVVAVAAGVWLPPAAAPAYSLLPLVTEQAQTLPRGVAEVILGVAYFNDLRFPPFTPPGAIQSQTLIGVPQFGFRIAAGGWAEIQASYETLYLNETASGESNEQFGSGDLRLFTKVRLRHQRGLFPAFGLRFGTKLPNAVSSSHLGTDDTDFGADVLASRDFGPLAAHVNLGLLLLGNPGPNSGNPTLSGGGQDDLFSYGVAVTSAPLGQLVPAAVALRLLGEVSGQAGSHFDNDRAAARFGLQLQHGHGTFYVGVSAGLITASENIGASTGFIYSFEPGKLLGAD